MKVIDLVLVILRIIQENMETATFIVGTVTLFVLAIYTFFTYRISKESRRQTESIIRQTDWDQAPMLVATWENKEKISGYFSGMFVLKNIGKGAAMNVKVNLAGDLKYQYTTIKEDKFVNEDGKRDAHVRPIESIGNISDISIMEFNRVGYVNSAPPDNFTSIELLNEEECCKKLEPECFDISMALQPTNINHKYKIKIGYSDQMKQKYISLLQAGKHKNDYKLIEYKKLSKNEEEKYKEYFA